MTRQNRTSSGLCRRCHTNLSLRLVLPDTRSHSSVGHFGTNCAARGSRNIVPSIRATWKLSKYSESLQQDVRSNHRSWVIPCQINRGFPLTLSDSFEIWHTCRNCSETNIRQFFLSRSSSYRDMAVWKNEKVMFFKVLINLNVVLN